MGVVAKTIKIIVTADVSDLQKRADATQRLAKQAAEQLEKSNQALVGSNESIAKSNEEIARSNEKTGRSFKVLGAVMAAAAGGLKLLSVGAGLFSSALPLLLIPLTTQIALIIKFRGVLEAAAAGFATFRDAAVRAGTILGSFALNFWRPNLQAFLLFEALANRVAPRFPVLASAISATGVQVVSFGQRISGAALALSSFLLSFSPVQKTVRVLGTAFTATAGSVSGFFATLAKGNDQFPRFHAFLNRVIALLTPLALGFEKVALAVAPLLSKLLSFSAILPGIGIAVTGLVGLLTVKLFGALRRAGDRLTELVVQAAQGADEFAKLSIVLGVNAETLQQFQFAASASGIQVDVFNTALQRFLERLGEARLGTGEIVKDLRALGISLNDANGFARDGVEVFEEYLARIQATSNQSEKLRLATAAFGRAGARMLTLAALSATELKGLRDQAEDLGLVLSKGTIRRATELNDQLEIFARQRAIAAQESWLSLGRVTIFYEGILTKVSVAFTNLLRPLRALDSFTLRELRKDLEQVDQRLAKIQRSTLIRLLSADEELVLLRKRKDLLEAIQRIEAEDQQPGGSASERSAQEEERVKEEIANLQRRLEEQNRLTEALRVGEDERARVADAIAAENAVRQLGVQLNDAEATSIMATTIQLREREREEEKLLEQHRLRLKVSEDLAKSEQIRTAALQDLNGELILTDSALLRSISTLLGLANASGKTRDRFDELEAELSANVARLEEVETELAKTGSEMTGTSKDSEKLSKEADKLREAIKKARDELVSMQKELKRTADVAVPTGNALTALQVGFTSVARGASHVNDAMEENQSRLVETGDVAEGAARGLQSVARAQREIRDLGKVVGGAGDAVDIERALARLNAQLKQATFSAGGAGRIQQRSLRAEIDRLEAEVSIQRREEMNAVIDAIISANREFTGEELTRRIDEELAQRARRGLLPSAAASRPGFVSVQGSRF